MRSIFNDQLAIMKRQGSSAVAKAMAGQAAMAKKPEPSVKPLLLVGINFSLFVSMVAFRLPLADF